MITKGPGDFHDTLGDAQANEYYATEHEFERLYAERKNDSAWIGQYIAEAMDDDSDRGDKEKLNELFYSGYGTNFMILIRRMVDKRMRDEAWKHAERNVKESENG